MMSICVNFCDVLRKVVTFDGISNVGFLGQ